MAKITDLPPEVVSAIFRQFLSAELPNHEYLCYWDLDLEEDARQTRATLYALSMVCKAFSELALLLLYEQLFDEPDLQQILECKPTPDVLAQRMAHVRYLRIDIDMRGNRLQNKRTTDVLRVCASLCVQIQHLGMSFTGSTSDTGLLLREFSKLPALGKLQSLNIHIRSPDPTHTIFRDVCDFDSICGLHISFDEGIMASRANPTKPLAHLKQLEMEQIMFQEDITACMALAAPDTLENLKVWEDLADPSANISVGLAFSSRTWPRLAQIWWGGDSSLGPKAFVSHTSQLPGLKRLRLGLEYDVPLERSLPTLPPGLQSIWIEYINQFQMLQALSLIRDGSWLGDGMQSIMLDFEEIENDEWDEEVFSKEILLEAAQEALMAAEAKQVVLLPKDLLEMLDKAKFWTRTPSIDSDGTASTFSDDGDWIDSDD